MSIGVSDTIKVCIALFAADSFSRLTEAVDAAVAKYSYLHGDSGSSDDNAVDEVSFSGNLSVFPNPVSDMLEILGVEGKYELKLYNSLGKCVFSGENVSRIDVSSYSAGIYTVSVSNNNGTSKANFVKVTF